MKFRHLLVAAAAMVIASPVMAATYYVRKTGNNSNPGTSAGAAWLTIDKAANTALAGDTVYVGAGTYTEQVTPNNDGTALAHVRVVADSSGAYTGDAGTITLQAPSGKVALRVDSDDYQEWVGFNIVGSNRDVVTWRRASGGIFENCVISGGSADGLQVTGGNVTVTACTIHTIGVDGINVAKSSSTQSTVYVYSTTIYGVGGDGVNLKDTSTVTLAGCTIYNASGKGVYFETATSTLMLRESTIYSCVDGVHVSATGNATIVNCLIRNCSDSAIELENNASTSVAAWHTTMTANTGSAFWIKGGTATVKDCILASNTGNGFKVGGGTLTHTYNNIYSNTAGNFSGTALSTGEITGNPLFVGSGSYQLQATSPCVDSGTSGSAVTTIDMLGVSRPGGSGWDMGCYERAGTPLFTDVSSSTGFNVQTSSDAGNYGSGLHWADLNNDGYLDCIVTGDTAKLCRSSSGASFVVTAFGGGNVSRQGALADYDNDGDIDFFAVAVGDTNTEALFTNNGSATFTNAGTVGMSAGAGNEACAAVDLDWDGWCDLLMPSSAASYVGINAGSSSASFTASTDTAWGLMTSGDYGDGDFCSTADVNNDGFPDLFYHYNFGRLLLSEGDGTYTSSSSGISVVTGSSDKFGSAWADYDNDGDMDLFAARCDSSNTGYLWRNDAGTFFNLTAPAGLGDTSGQRSACWGDYDNDGDLDLYIVTITGGNKLYRSEGDGTFQLVSNGAGITGNNHDACFVDYDNDGDLDISITSEDTTNTLLRNGTNGSNYLKVRVVGAGDDATNVAAVGVRVELYNSAGTTLLQRREVGQARGLGGSEPQWVHFGGVTPATTYLVKVYFVSGAVSTSVVPSTASSTVGATLISQMVTITEAPPAGVQVLQWQETDPIDP